MTIQQISVFLENRAGQLTDITGILCENGINLRAINIAETADYGVLRLITDNSPRALEVLSAQGLIVTTTPVCAVAVPDRPGGLNEVLAVLSNAGINIIYMYSVFGQKDGKAYMIFRVNDIELMQTVLQEHGVCSVCGEELGLH